MLGLIWNSYVAAVIEAPELLRAALTAWRASAAERARWSAAETFADLCELSAQFCEGTLTKTPDHGGPRAPETVQIAGPLAHINRQGFLTNGSQPGMAEEWGEQRAVVEGWARPETVAQLRRLIAGTRLRIQANRPGSWRADYRQSFPATRTVAEDGSIFIHTDFGFIPGATTPYIDLGRGDLVDGALYVTVSDPNWGAEDLLWRRLSAPDWDNPPLLTDEDRAPATAPDMEGIWPVPRWAIRLLLGTPPASPRDTDPTMQGGGMSVPCTRHRDCMRNDGHVDGCSGVFGRPVPYPDTLRGKLLRIAAWIYPSDRIGGAPPPSRPLSQAQFITAQVDAALLRQAQEARGEKSQPVAAVQDSAVRTPDPSPQDLDALTAAHLSGVTPPEPPVGTVLETRDDIETYRIEHLPDGWALQLDPDTDEYGRTHTDGRISWPAAWRAWGPPAGAEQFTAVSPVAPQLDVDLDPEWCNCGWMAGAHTHDRAPEIDVSGYLTRPPVVETDAAEPREFAVLDQRFYLPTPPA